MDELGNINKLGLMAVAYPDTAPNALKNAYKYLSASIPKRSLQSEQMPQFAVRLASASLKCVALIASKYPNVTDNLLLPLNWRAIWKWSRYLLENFVEKVMAISDADLWQSQLKTEVTLSTSKLFSMLCLHSSTSAQVLKSTSNFVELFTRLWVLEGDSESPSDEKHLSCVISYLLSRSITDTAVYASFMRAMNNDRQSVARAILRRIFLSSRKASRDINDFHSNLVILSALDQTNKELALTIPMNASMSILANALYRFAQAWTSGEMDRGPAQRDTLQRCFHLALSYIAAYSSLDRALAAEAVESNLLLCLLAFPAIFGDKPSANILHVYNAILDLLAKDSICYTILRRVDISLKVVDASNADSVILNGGPYEKPWALLRRATADRLELKAHFLRNVPAVCAAYGCPLKGTNRTRMRTVLKICGGCLAAPYCSVECQKRSWPDHRSRCLRPWSFRKAGMIPDAEETRSPRDLYFYHECIASDVRFKADTVKTLKNQYMKAHADINPRQLMVHLDYTRHRDHAYPWYTITIAPAEEARQMEDIKHQWQRVVDAAAMFPKRTMVLATIPRSRLFFHVFEAFEI